MEYSNGSEESTVRNNQPQCSATPGYIVLVRDRSDPKRKRNVGTGIVVGKKHVLTARHVVAPEDECADVARATQEGESYEVVCGDRQFAAVDISEEYFIDLALLRLDEEVPAEPARIIAGLSEDHRAPLVAADKRGVSIKVYGYTAKSGGEGVKHNEAEILSIQVDQRGNLVDMQLHHGVQEGFSGGPLVLRREGSEGVLGVMHLGGEGAATSRAHLAPVLLDFLQENGFVAATIDADEIFGASAPNPPSLKESQNLHFHNMLDVLSGKGGVGEADAVRALHAELTKHPATSETLEAEPRAVIVAFNRLSIDEGINCLADAFDSRRSARKPESAGVLASFALAWLPVTLEKPAELARFRDAIDDSSHSPAETIHELDIPIEVLMAAAGNREPIFSLNDGAPVPALGLGKTSVRGMDEDGAQKANEVEEILTKAVVTQEDLDRIKELIDKEAKKILHRDHGIHRKDATGISLERRGAEIKRQIINRRLDFLRARFGRYYLAYTPGHADQDNTFRDIKRNYPAMFFLKKMCADEKLEKEYDKYMRLAGLIAAAVRGADPY